MLCEDWEEERGSTGEKMRDKEKRERWERDRGGEDKKGQEKAYLNWPVWPRCAVMVWDCQTLCLNSWPGLTCIPCIRPTTTNSSVLFGSFQCQAWESCATHIYTLLHSSGSLSDGDGCVGLGLWCIWLHCSRLSWHFCSLSIVCLLWIML